MTTTLDAKPCTAHTDDISISTCVMEGSHIHFATYIDVYVNNIRTTPTVLKSIHTRSHDDNTIGVLARE